MKRYACLAALLALAACESPAEPPVPATRPQLALLTSLPIVFAEGFSLETQRNELLAALEKEYEVMPVDGPEQLRPGGVLLAIQPQALTAERLVALDAWVRRGGRLVLLADPSLLWESELPLGDRFRPPYAYPDTGLLRHWGLTLGQEGVPAAEIVTHDLGNGISAEASSFGTLATSSRDCRLSHARTVARCRLGRGQVTVVADADFAMRQAVPGNQQAVVRLVGELSR